MPETGFKTCSCCANNDECNIKIGFKQYLKLFFPKAKASQIITVSNFIAEACPVYRYRTEKEQTKEEEQKYGKTIPDETEFNEYVKRVKAWQQGLIHR